MSSSIGSLNSGASFMLHGMCYLWQKEVLYRTEDIVARYGGEEFVIIMPGIDMENGRGKYLPRRVQIDGTKLWNKQY